MKTGGIAISCNFLAVDIVPRKEKKKKVKFRKSNSCVSRYSMSDGIINNNGRRQEARAGLGILKLKRIQNVRDVLENSSVRSRVFDKSYESEQLGE